MPQRSNGWVNAMAESKAIERGSMAARGFPPIKLNSFQRVMLLWEEVHAYNAACVVQLRGPLDTQRLRDSIETTCRHVGLGRMVVDAKRAVLHFEPLDTVALKLISAAGQVSDPSTRAPALAGGSCSGFRPTGVVAGATGLPVGLNLLNEVLTEEINAPFPAEAHDPIRWILVMSPESGFLVAVWRHVVADAESLRMLLAEILSRYYEGPHKTKGTLTLNARETTRMIRSQWARLGYFNSVKQAIRLYSRMRRVYRLPESKDGGHNARVLLLGAPDGLLRRLRAGCRIRRVNVHDAFLTALMAALAELTPERRTHRKRRGLALATAVNLRRIDREKFAGRFGLYAGHWINTLDEPEAMDLEGILQEMTRQTQIEKSAERYVGLEWHWRTLLFLRRWLSVNENRTWYRKVYPLSAGVSHVRLNGNGFGAAQDNVLRYFLVPPPGPAVPLVVAPASLDENLTFAAVYREAALNASQVAKLMDGFFACLARFAGTES